MNFMLYFQSKYTISTKGSTGLWHQAWDELAILKADILRASIDHISWSLSALIVLKHQNR